jgi:alkyl sulfatase BDS1-like metallo-beta-lactamase superfamily hydrolase
MRADLQDRADFENADRGFVASLARWSSRVPMAVEGDQGVIVIDPLISREVGLLDAPGANFAVVTP